MTPAEMVSTIHNLRVELAEVTRQREAARNTAVVYEAICSGLLAEQADPGFDVEKNMDSR